MTIHERLTNAWNAFKDNKSITSPPVDYDVGEVSYRKPDRIRLTRGNERTIITAIYTRIAIDASAIAIKHVTTDEHGNYAETINSKLNRCLTVSANMDQTGRAFIQDVVMSMLDDGCVAIVPTDIRSDFGNLWTTESFDVLKMRTGKIKEWKPNAVLVDLYNERTGKHEQTWLPKTAVAIVENPFYAIMNEPNSTFYRLIRKLNIMDTIDDLNGSGKFNMIIQLPYTTRTEMRQQQAEKRRKELEKQLTDGNNYGIAYADVSEKIVQLNRSIDNQMMDQVSYLTSMLYSQLGVTEDILKGTADEQVTLNYYNRTVNPIVNAITDEMKRKFLSRTAISQGQSIMAFRNVFNLVPLNNLAEIADKFTRNEIMTSNEIRQIIGLRPADDPKADELINSNLNHPEENQEGRAEPTNKEEIQNGQGV